jgi:outer membrane lipoprotein SlyB
MKKELKATQERDTIPPPSHTHGSETGAIAGEVVGGLVGAAAGPVGAVAGMVIGAAAGALVGEVMDREANRAHAHDEALDRDVGVMGGNLGAVQPARPKSVPPLPPPVKR